MRYIAASRHNRELERSSLMGRADIICNSDKISIDVVPALLLLSEIFLFYCHSMACATEMKALSRLKAAYCRSALVGVRSGMRVSGHIT